MNSKLITNHILMVRPAHFGFNPETAASNSFQTNDPTLCPQEISARAIEEFDQVVHTLLDHGIDVFVAEDSAQPIKTDAVFPNNWISFHDSGLVITYPMMSASRRNEIRMEILDDLSVHFQLDEIWRLDEESTDQYLEGTGSMVLDREHKLAYACRSPRTSASLLDRFCQKTGFRAVQLDSHWSDGKPIYHTNVLMAITQKFLIVCLDSLVHAEQVRMLEQLAQDAGKRIMPLGMEQIGKFAGNLLQLGRPGQRPVLAMSSAAFESLSPVQVDLLQSESELVAMPVPTIETYGGGSIRCMLAEIFLTPRVSVESDSSVG